MLQICRNQKSQFENQLHDVKFNLIQQLEQQIKVIFYVSRVTYN